jgi:transposase
MGAPYSEDLRLRVLGALDGGMSKMKAYQRFRVSRSTLDDWLLLRAATGAVQAKTRRGCIGKRAVADLKVFEAFAVRYRHATLGQMKRAWQEEQGQLLSEQTFSTMLSRLGWTRKKRASFTASETLKNEPPSSPR